MSAFHSRIYASLRQDVLPSVMHIITSSVSLKQPRHSPFREKDPDQDRDRERERDRERDREFVPIRRERERDYITDRRDIEREPVPDRLSVRVRQRERDRDPLKYPANYRGICRE